MMYDRPVKKSTPEIIQMDVLSILFVHVFALTKKTQMLEVQSQANAEMEQVMSCDNFGDDNPWDQCPLKAKSVNYIGNFNRNQINPCSNTYNLGEITRILDGEEISPVGKKF